MPPIESIDRHQYAVLWPAEAVNEMGEVTVGDPVQIKVRWEDKQTQALNNEGNVVKLDALVVVNQDITKGSKMLLGKLTDLPSGVGTGPDVNDIPGLMEVQIFTSVPDIKGRHKRRVVGLRRFRDELPSEE
jgi:hypothetical protein